MQMRKRGGYALTASPLYRASSRRRLAVLIGISNGELRFLQSGDLLYQEKDIPKRSGNGTRHIENPTRRLKITQARIAKLLMRVAPPDFLFCPVKGRSYVDNAAAHMGARVVRCLDIKNFFPSVPSRRVFWFFHKVMECERDIAALLTSMSTYKGHLPTGSPLSPILAYFAYLDLWEKVSAFCTARGLRLTVYIDDCTISGNSVTDADLWEVKQLIYSYGLRYHKEKTYRRGFAEVTGVIVRSGYITVPNRQLKKLREGKRQIVTDGVNASPELKGTVNGLLGQVRHVAVVNARASLSRAPLA